MTPALCHDVVVVAASAGGVGALRALVAELPQNLPAAVLVVLHLPAEARSTLPSLLARSGPLPARHVRDGDPLRRAVVQIAPPGQHLVVDGPRLRLSAAPREHGLRPAADPLLRTAAATYRARVCAVVLSGTRSDGAAGASRVLRSDGVVIVQDPEEASFGEMPTRTLELTGTPHVLPVRDIAALITTLAYTPISSVSSRGPA